ncbi:M20 family metallopeptidase [Rhizobium rhizogenes]|uniref:M20 family metallopeptidase n=1 Tax=Rhizobium rhizogenes TaxID=359 RepID=UPI0015741C83|nr:ArgE/DapE family deacylase [Rhizobium rhizogenes]NTF65767.1 M20 family metallopeptidase [Rhizobium rhizogenes]NTG97119.1 M20 family metallopeptidase [Rhizobium rhizogenes]
MSFVDQLLYDLISIPSENPGGNEKAVASYCAEMLRKHQLDVQIVSDDPDRPNVICEIGRGDGPVVILQGHLDTKPAAHNGSEIGEWLRSGPFTPFEEQGLVYGLGACDTKGGVAAQLAAFVALSKRRDLAGTVIWQGVADEENGSRHGAELLLARGLLSADAAIVAEPTGGIPSFDQLGNCWTQLHIKGKAAHGGLPWLGVDAIAVTLEVLRLMQRRVAEVPRDKRYLSHPAVRAGAIHGGGHAGTVASECTLVTDIRVRPGERRELYLSMWQEVVAEARSLFSECRIQLDLYAGGGCEPHAIDADGPYAGAVHRAWREMFGVALEPTQFFGGSDARYFAEAGTPAIVLGPGNLAQAHSPNEFVPIEEVRRTATVIERIVDIVCGSERRYR